VVDVPFHFYEKVYERLPNFVRSVNIASFHCLRLVNLYGRIKNCCKSKLSKVFIIGAIDSLEKSPLKKTHNNTFILHNSFRVHTGRIGINTIAH